MEITLTEALGVLRRNAKTLRARGVARAAVFGSVARREAHADSDVDILIEIDRERAIGLFDYAELCEDIANLFPVRVDVVNSRKLKPLLRDSILRDCIDAF